MVAQQKQITNSNKEFSQVGSHKINTKTTTLYRVLISIQGNDSFVVHLGCAYA